MSSEYLDLNKKKKQKWTPHSIEEQLYRLNYEYNFP